jgi:hypothetical protein
MGLIVNENYVAANGVQKQGVYISFNNETVYLRKGSPVPNVYPVDSTLANKYEVRANYRVFWDKDAKDSGKSFLELNSVSAFLSEQELNGNLYTCLYNELKKKYVNSVDAI